MRITQKLITSLSNNTNGVLAKLSAEDIAYIVKKANEAYHSKGTPLFTDDTFDIIKEHLASLDKSAEVLNEVGSIPITGKKTTLPFYMGSMDKIKSDDRSLDQFKQRFTGDYLISDKLDGISALLHVKLGKYRLYTRGDGIIGQDITHLMKYVQGFPDESVLVTLANTMPNQELAVRGELILTKEDFDKVKNRGANARNMVAGIVNAKKPDIEIARLVHFMAYSLVAPNNITPYESLRFLLANGFFIVHNELISSQISFDTLSSILLRRRSESPFEIDGIIVAHNAIHPLVSGKNPVNAFAYKNLVTQETAEVIVTNVEWNASKDGYLVPVVQFEPISISGVVIKRASGFNGDFIKSNKIGPGARIVIVRSGDVIPFILRVVTPANEPQMPTESYNWTESGKDIYIKDALGNKQVQLRQLENFFMKLNVPGLRAGTITKLFNAGLDDLQKIIKADVNTIAKIDGFQIKSAETIVANIRQKLSMLSCVELMDASNAFGRGFGSKRLSTIVKAIPLLLSDDKYKPTRSELMLVDGVSDKTADAFLKGLDIYRDFKKSLGVVCTTNESPSGSNIKSNKFENHVVVFTGFRNAELKAMIEENGGSVVDTITKKTTILIAKDIEKSSSKIEKAKEHGVTVYSLTDFTSRYV